MFKRKLKGGALYIALIISILIGVMLSVFILIASFNQRQVISRVGQDQLKCNLISGFNYAQSKYFNESINGIWRKCEFNDDSIKVISKQWGAFRLISCETKNNRQSEFRSGLFGCNAARDTAMVMREVTRPLSLAGKIRFNGMCYIPKGQFKATSIEGSSFNPLNNINLFIRNAPSNLPELSKTFKTNLERSGRAINFKIDSLISNIDVLSNSFKCKTAVYENSNILLFNNKLEGNIKLIASDKVVIANEAQLNNVYIVARKVYIKKGFKGIVHVQASDSIVIEEGCELNYPSSLVVSNYTEKINTAVTGIYIQDKCKIMGAVIAYSKNKENKVMVSFGKDSEIYGLLFSSCYASLKGKYFGNVYVDRLMLKTPTALYDNHLLDAELDSRKFSNSLVIPMLFENENKLKCAKWL